MQEKKNSAGSRATVQDLYRKITIERERGFFSLSVYSVHSVVVERHS